MQTHESFTRTYDVPTASERSFGLIFAAFFSIVAGVRWWGGHPDWMGWIGFAFVFAVLALFWTTPLAPLNRLWARLGGLLHAIVNPLLMGLIFVVAVVPTGLLLRLFGRDLLRLRRDPAATTYWIACDRSATRKDGMKDQF